MKIKCHNCGHSEETDLDFFVKAIGAAMPIGGYWAWVTFLFAGTGFAMVIVIAIIAGGTAMLAYKDEIVEWIINNDYKCPKCGQVEWKADLEENETPKTVSKLANAEPISSSNCEPKTPDEIHALFSSFLAIGEPDDTGGNTNLANELQARIKLAEALLRVKGYEFDTEGDGWVILEPSGDLKEISSIGEFEQYAISV